MASELFSFRLSGSELEWLKTQQDEGETLNLTAKRLLLSLMNSTVDTPVDTPVDTRVDTTVDTQAIKAEIKEEILEIIEVIIKPIKEALVEDREKLERVANTVNDLVEKTTDNNQPYTPVNTSVDIKTNTEQANLQSKTVEQLRRMAKQLGITYTTRTKKPELISMISARKSSKNL
ncbi:MAG: Rho termination factor N-terminal domain-containing protein [Planktothrix sp.]|uniref:Rho termination factor N-terminal domain-containing protein n=1 Tax=Planktothrix sp. TaxID=3088171 RepID=UPI0038D3B94E